MKSYDNTTLKSKDYFTETSSEISFSFYRFLRLDMTSERKFIIYMKRNHKWGDDFVTLHTPLIGKGYTRRRIEKVLNINRSRVHFQ